MSSGRQAAYDDELEWEALKKARRITDVRWVEYSPEARIVKTSPTAYDGARLKLYVTHQIEQQELKCKQDAEVEEFKTYQKLKEKFK